MTFGNPVKSDRKNIWELCLCAPRPAGSLLGFFFFFLKERLDVLWLAKMRKMTPGALRHTCWLSIGSGGGGGNNKWDRRSWRLRRRAAATSIGRQKWLSFKKGLSLVVACPQASLSGRMNPQHCYKSLVTASCMLIAEIMMIICMDMATFL